MKKFCLVAVIVLILTVLLKADTIILKDEQKFEADVQTFDSYYLVVKLQNGKTLSLPWGEVRYIKHTTTASSWLEETYMNNDDVDVTSMVIPLSPQTAFDRALFPGIVWHGAGHFYAKNNNTGLSLLSAEIVSAFFMIISANEMLSPEVPNQPKAMSKIVFFTGLGFFSGSWLYDLIFAGGAAENYNQGKEFAAGSK